ncbi:MAG: hypothetical protein Q9186_005863, partial [Xanthomendoza sp. 1 TL-2023]
YFNTFENPVKTEGDAALEHIGSYAGPIPFMADNQYRPDGFALLDQMLMPMASPKYSHFNGNLDGPSLILFPLPSLLDILDEWLQLHPTILPRDFDWLHIVGELSSAVLAFCVRQPSTNYFDVSSLLACIMLPIRALLQAWQSCRLMLADEK